MSRVRINYDLASLLHPGQLEVASHPARFKVLNCGRRWGKTRLGVALCTATALRGGYTWWVAPSYPIAGIGWDEAKSLARQMPIAEIREGERIVRFPSGGWLQVRSADNPDSLRGRGLDFVVMDECAFMKEAAWNEALRPALSDRAGLALFISTPNGRNWFYNLWLRGVSGDDPSWQSWSFPTTANPFINPLEVESAREQLPAITFAQEYLAEFIADGGLVFRNIGACVDPSLPLSAPLEYSNYVMGVDWAQVQDFTCIMVMDADTHQLVYSDHFNQLGWDVQRGRLKAIADYWGCKAILAEHNAIGGPNIEQLQIEGLPVISFETTSDSKNDLIRALVLAFERGEVAIPPNDALIAELESFAADRLPSGKWRYSAPPGMHDDRVIALALAYWQSLTGYENAGGINFGEGYRIG